MRMLLIAALSAIMVFTVVKNTSTVETVADEKENVCDTLLEEVDVVQSSQETEEYQMILEIQNELEKLAIDMEKNK